MTYLKGLLHKQNDKAPNLYYISGKSDFDPEKLFFEIFVSDSQFSCPNRSNALKKLAASYFCLRNPKNNVFVAVRKPGFSTPYGHNFSSQF